MADVQAGARQVVVLGGTGRVGTAVVDEFTARGQKVIAVSRRPASVERPLVRHVRGDVEHLAAVFCGVDVGGVVVAVTPFTAPPESFDGFDGDFYVRIIEQLQALLPARTRVVDIAVTAIARLRDGTTVAEDPALLPARLQPFSDAHARGVDLLATSSSLDGTVLIPAAGLGVSIEPEGSAQPLLKAEPVTIDDATGPLDHTVLARAVAEQLNDIGSIKRLLVRNSPAG